MNDVYPYIWLRLLRVQGQGRSRRKERGKLQSDALSQLTRRINTQHQDPSINASVHKHQFMACGSTGKKIYGWSPMSWGQYSFIFQMTGRGCEAKLLSEVKLACIMWTAQLSLGLPLLLINLVNFHVLFFCFKLTFSFKLASLTGDNRVNLKWGSQLNLSKCSEL